MKITAMGIGGLLAAAVFGCSSKSDVDIGDDRSASLGASLSDYAGTWEGYAEAYTFLDDTDRVRLTLDSTGNGTLELGNDRPGLPAPDPDSAPPGWQLMGNSSVDPGLLIGYPFTVTGATIESTRIKLTTQTPAEYEQWCALQTPALDPSDPQGLRYACLPGNGMHSDGTTCWLIPTETEVPCAKIKCLEACACTATTCTFRNYNPLDLDAALELDGNRLVGTLVVLGLRVTVRLEK